MSADDAPRNLVSLRELKRRYKLNLALGSALPPYDQDRNTSANRPARVEPEAEAEVEAEGATSTSRPGRNTRPDLCRHGRTVPPAHLQPAGTPLAGGSFRIRDAPVTGPATGTLLQGRSLATRDRQDRVFDRGEFPDRLSRCVTVGASVAKSVSPRKYALVDVKGLRNHPRPSDTGVHACPGFGDPRAWTAGTNDLPN